MLIGVPTEIKNNEYRVGMVPAGVHELVASGHQLFVQAGAGAGIGVSDEAYRAAGAEIVPDAATVYGRAEMVVRYLVRRGWRFVCAKCSGSRTSTGS